MAKKVGRRLFFKRTVPISAKFAIGLLAEIKKNIQKYEEERELLQCLAEKCRLEEKPAEELEARYSVEIAGLEINRNTVVFLEFLKKNDFLWQGENFRSILEIERKIAFTERQMQRQFQRIEVLKKRMKIKSRKKA